tara:strand:+ start:6233 stop:7372 length:1140 start_codon:yes stop_codon:yes gene_type:complete
MIQKKNLNFKILWIGPYVPLKAITNWKATSPAAVKWQFHLLESLIKNKINLKWIYYRPESYWPKGKLLPSKILIKKVDKFHKKQIHYLNLLGLKYLTKKIFLKKILLEEIKKKKTEPLILISYNSPTWINTILSDKMIKSKIICIYLLADDQVKCKADGYIFLSYQNFINNISIKNKLHLDGAIYPPIKTKKKIKKNKTIIFLYSGSLHEYGGAQNLIKAINHIKKNNFELWISGTGNSKIFKDAASKDKRIKFFGLLSNSQLDEKYREADIFLNPRITKRKDNNYNFPSKLFDYLSWQKPIISTWTKGLSPEYKTVLDISKEEPKDLALTMQKYLNNRAKKLNINKEFINKKNWDNEARKLILFLKKIIKNQTDLFSQ